MSDVNTIVSQAVDKLTGRDNRKVLSYCDEIFQQAKRDRNTFERQWYTNLAFFAGKQWVQWRPAIGDHPARLYEPAAPPWRVRLISNKIRPIVRTEIAKITKEKPQVFVVPSTSDDTDLYAARAGEAIFEHEWREKKINRVLRQAAFWTVTCGTGFIKDWWDPKEKKGDYTGCFNIERVTPFHVYIADTSEEDLERQAFIIHAMVKPVEWVERIFKKKVPPESAGSSEANTETYFSVLGLTSSNRKDTVTVKEAWIRPCSRFPSGGVVTWAGETLLSATEGWPYKHEEFPFSHVNHIQTGRFYGDSAITDLIPLQKEYNRTRSQMVEAKNRTSKPQLMAPRGSIDPNKVTSEPGLIIFYTPGLNPPTPLPPQEIPSYVTNEIELIQRDMDDISSQHEITKGRTPPGVTAATAISYLQEEDDSKLANTVSNLEEAVEKIGKHVLSHAIQFWKTDRLVKVVGENNVIEAMQLSSSDLKGNSDLRVEAGSATPRSKAAKQAFITELGQMGWIAPDQGLKYLEMAETGRLYEEAQIDARQAQRENIKMAKHAIMVNPNTWDNHEAHIAEHNNYRKRQEFENLPDEFKVLFEQHVALHQQTMMGQQGMGPVTPEQAQMMGSQTQAPEGMMGPLGEQPETTEDPAANQYGPIPPEGQEDAVEPQ